MVVMNPKYSIIVPIYNSAHSLEKCIQSILNQTFSDFELLLINDGSTDATQEICNEYASQDPRIKVFHKENGGVSSARNLGLNFASGYWVTFCDADDWVDKDWLLNFGADNKFDIICQGMKGDYSLWKAIKREDSTCGVDYVGEVPTLLALLYRDMSLGYVVTKCFKNDILQGNLIRFDERFNCHEDEEFILRYLLYCNYGYSNKQVGYYYLCPIFDEKYILKTNVLELYSSMYTCVKTIYKGEMNNVVYNYLDSYTMALLSGFVNFPNLADIRCYRANVGKQIFNTRLFFITKVIISYDFTNIVAFVVLYIHSAIKRFIPKRVKDS